MNLVSKNILFIEPDNILGTVYQKALQADGHTVMRCRTAEAAVDQADKITPDVVVLEMQLPGHSGAEFLYEFRSYAEWQKIPIILHTLVPEQHLLLPEQLGIGPHLYKPITTLQHLKRVIMQTMLGVLG